MFIFAARQMTTVGYFILVLGILFLAMYCNGFPTSFVLERIDSMKMNHSEIITRDQTRHSHIFQRPSVNGIVNLPLLGFFHASRLGRYFTRIKVGNPSRDYYVMIDTGSDLTWINCISCTGCPRTSTLFELSFFDPHNSTSAAPISCSNKICHHCSSNSFCGYSFPYGDGTSVSGFYVSDTFHFDTIIGNSVTAISSPNIYFGCSNNESGLITKLSNPMDGLLGLGHHPISITSQLAARGITPNVFSHCLKAEAKGGGGILVLGEIIEPGIIYTPLVLSKPHYNVNLLSISIGGKKVPIHPNFLATSKDRGTIIDSGSTLAYLAEEAYDPFVTSLVAATPPSVSSFSVEGKPCFKISTRDVFPLISLNFEGGASMILKPEEYLLKHDVDLEVWCLGFLKNELQFSHGMTILGDLVLKDKVIIYDLARQRLGWVAYDCSLSVNVSLVPPRTSNSSRHRFIPIATGGFIVYFLMFAGFLFL